MFWAASLKQGTTLNLSSLASQGDLLHLSHVNLAPTSPAGPTTLFITSQGKKIALATLDKSTKDYRNFDLYFSTTEASVFSVTGAAELALLGYFEPGDEVQGNRPARENGTAQARQAVEENSEGSEEEDVSEEDLPEPVKPQHKPVAEGDLEESEEDEEETSEDEESDQEESEDEESEEEDEESEEEVGQKRPAPEQTPTPAKKTHVEPKSPVIQKTPQLVQKSPQPQSKPQSHKTPQSQPQVQTTPKSQKTPQPQKTQESQQKPSGQKDTQDKPQFTSKEKKPFKVGKESSGKKHKF